MRVPEVPRLADVRQEFFRPRVLRRIEELIRRRDFRQDTLMKERHAI